MRILRVLLGLVLTLTTMTVADRTGVAATAAPDTDVGTVDPARLLDTRPNGATIDGDFQRSGKVAGGTSTTIQITGRGGVPTDAVGVELNITAIQSDGNGFATLYPCTTEPPTASTLNYTTGVNIANATTVALNTDGEVCIFTSTTSHYALDVVAYIPAGSGVGTVDPARLLDTRPNGATIDGDFQRSGKVAGGTSTTIQITGRGGVPTDAVGVELNITAIQSDGNGFATLYPCTTEPPTASTLNYTTGVNIANATTVALNTDGEVCIFTSTTSHYALDVVASIPAGSGVGTVDPARLLDTRPNGATIDGDFQRSGKVAGGTSTTIQITGRGGVPTDAVGVELNITAIQSDGNGFATLYPCTTEPPTASTLNYTTGVNIANATTVALNTDGEVCIFTSTTSHYALDVVAYIAPTEDPGGNGIVRVGRGPQDVEFDGTDIWVVGQDLSRIDPVSGTVIATLPVPGTRVTFDGTDIWTAGGTSVNRIDRSTNQVTSTIDIGVDAFAIAAVTGDSVWVTNRVPGPDTVTKIDIATELVTATVDVGRSPQGVEFDGTDIWVSSLDDGTLSRIDPTADTVTETIPIGAGGAIGMTFDGTDMWVANLFSDSVSQIDRATNTVVDTIDVGDAPHDVTFDGTDVWVTNSGDNTVSRIDRDTNTVTETITVGGTPRGITFDGTSIGIANRDSDYVSLIAPS